ncbi:uncharacterized protein BX664DRAFT_326784 [Halteromyces radiatus]|uniref:uncharacterized protein n=1 Tax=Halteromyces radiatus TaxID=101107 RepID=UPI00221FAAF3|nr:uncharacterized protein BX664DRAFT_326784 [Halteromyces radiatus]KAI8097604.1 hypothetical protein BX664DRAFT_326784 [Halteromyces radiatus]
MTTSAKPTESILGDSLKVESSLDSLFKNSAGPSDAVSKPIATPILPFENNTDSITTTPESKKRKKIDTTIPAEDDILAMESLRKKNRPAVLTGDKQEKQKEKDERTVFVGNLPISSATKQGTKELHKLFGKYGKIESIRFRSFAMANHMDRKGAYITKKFHNNREEVNAYVVFKTKDEADQCAKELDGQVYQEKHLRVDNANASTAVDHKRSVFLGQLPFDVKDEELWDFFKTGCQVQRVRTVRDAQTNVGKGFGFVQFEDRDSVTVALAMEDKVFREPNHKIRIQRCDKLEDGARGSAKKFSKHNLKKSASKINKKKTTKNEKGSKRRTLPTPKLMEGTRSNKEQGNPLKIAKIVKKASKKSSKK